MSNSFNDRVGVSKSSFPLVVSNAEFEMRASYANLEWISGFWEIT